MQRFEAGDNDRCTRNSAFMVCSIMLTVIQYQAMAESRGASDYLTKPVDRASLIETLRRHSDVAP